MDLCATIKLDRYSLDQVSLSSIDRYAHAGRSDDVAIVSLAGCSEFLVIPRSAVADGVSHFQRLALKVRSVELAYLGLQIPQSLFPDFEIKLNE